MREVFLRSPRVAFIATYVPRQCGIGTFTYDLVNSLSKLYDENPVGERYLQVVGLNDIRSIYQYPPEVRFVIREREKGDYRAAADFLNLSPCEVVSLQHEFGIFGGEDGDFIIYLLENLKKPVVVTLHTILKEPKPRQREVLKAVCSLSTFVTVQAQRAIQMLTDIYGVPERKVVMIHHGAPDVPFLDPSYYKDQFQAEGRRVILTSGMLNPNKGIEYAIEAMHSVVEQFPDVLYLVLGATHPQVKRTHGEQYRLLLKQLVKKKGLEQHVVFHDRFVSVEQLMEFLVAADIYLTPYLSKEQIVSGTLAYAIACGKAIVSTPYWYAEELLGESLGQLVPFGDSEALAQRLIELLGNETLRNRMRKQAYQFGRRMIWREVARAYADVFERSVQEYGKRPMVRRIQQGAIEQPMLPEVKLDHLRILTDDTGVLQHAVFTTPNRFHGYSTDDNARALVMTIMNWQLFQDESILPLLQIYLAYLNHALDRKTDRMRNFMSYDRRWIEDIGSEDSHGRMVWAMGYAVAYAPSEAILGLATRLFKQVVRPCSSFTSPRSWAYSILGCLLYLQRFGGDTEVGSLALRLSRRLFDLFEAHATEDWPWCEDVVTYDNARLPQALIAMHRRVEDERMLRQGLRTLQWLLDVQTDPLAHHLSLIGNDGWLRRGENKARFDQQPIEVASLMEACYEASLATGERRWRVAMDQCFAWFFGRNDLHEMIYNFTTGGCFDGLHSTEVNQNQGAESTVCWLLALHCVHHVAHESVLRPNASRPPHQENGSFC